MTWLVQLPLQPIRAQTLIQRNHISVVQGSSNDRSKDEKGIEISSV